MIRSLAFALMLSALTACANLAQPTPSNLDAMPPSSKLTAERLFASPALSGSSPRAVKFSPDGKRVTFLKPRESDQSRLDLWQFDVATGAASMLIDSSLIDPADADLSEEEKALRERKRIAGTRGIADYDWGAADTLLVPAGGDLFLVTLSGAGTKVRKLTETDTYEYDARVSPAGNYVSFIRDGALYAIRLTTGEEMRLSPEAEPDKAISYGVAEFVAQEEMDRYTGYWWSPDDSHIAYTQVDESGVDIIPRFDIVASEVTVIEQRYPRAGRPNAVVTLLVRKLDETEPSQLGTFGPDSYLTRVNWFDGNSVMFQHVNRAQTSNTYERSDGTPWRVWSPMTETQEKWVNLSNDFQPLGKWGYIYSSEIGGSRQLLYASGDAPAEQITNGPYPVEALKHASVESFDVFFTVFEADSLERHLYRVEQQGRIAESGLSERLRREPAEGAVRVTEPGKSWSVTVAPDGNSFVGTSSSGTQPPQTGLYRIDGALIAWIEENRLDAGHPYTPYLESHTEPEFGTLTAEDGQTLYYSIQKPKDFDPKKRYPVIVEVYGGPGVQTVSREWGPLGDVFYNARGYVVFRLDNRGSSNRGKRFEDVIHRNMGDAEVRDQLLGIDWLKAQSFVDPAKIAIQGWSYGGYMTLKTILAAPEGTFAAAVAGASVTDWSLYDTFYTERYMGTPQDNAEGYLKSSVFPDLGKLSTPLLLVHGMADDNVTFDNTTRLMAALQELGKPFEAMTYPGQRHGIRGEPLQVHLMRTRMAFLDRHLKPEAE
jgi:dipeptidyl-peptidase 4